VPVFFFSLSFEKTYFVSKLNDIKIIDLKPNLAQVNHIKYIHLIVIVQFDRYIGTTLISFV